jgi:uncharacterized protein YjcR
MSEEMQLALEHTLKTMRELKEAADTITTLRATNERLRAALLKIKRGSVWHCDIEAFIDAALAEEKKDDR